MDFGDQLSRVERAQRIGAELAQEMEKWPSRSPWGVDPEIAEDRRSWTLRLRVREQPPLDEWGLRFGEAIHQLRSSLDNLAVTVAKASGVTDVRQLKSIQFPISSSQKDWAKDKSRIKYLPQAVGAAIEAVQPFQRLEHGGSLGEDLLVILRDLSNQDKHHLQVKPTLENVSLGHMPGVEFETEADAAMSIPPDIEFFVANFEDGELLLRHHTRGRIAKVKGSFRITVQVRVQLPDGRVMPILEILSMLCQYVEVVMRYVASHGASAGSGES